MLSSPLRIAGLPRFRPLLFVAHAVVTVASASAIELRRIYAETLSQYGYLRGISAYRGKVAIRYAET